MFAWFDKFIKMMDSHNALIIPGLFASFGTIPSEAVLYAIPDALSESAHIDGAGDFTIWRKIMPISKPAMATFMIIVFT